MNDVIRNRQEIKFNFSTLKKLDIQFSWAYN